MKRFIVLFLVLLSPFVFGAFSELDRSVMFSRNILANPGFEANKSNWSASGGVFNMNTTASNIGSGNASASWDASASGQFFSATANTLTAGVYSQNGLASCNIKGSGATHSLQVYDGSVVVAETVITSAATFVNTTLNFVFPSSGTLQLRLKSNANEPIIYIDDCYFGLAPNVGALSVVGPFKNDLTFTTENMGILVSSDFRYKQIGDTMEVIGQLTTGTVAASTCAIDLPTGYTIDSSKLTASANLQKLGDLIRFSGTFADTAHGPYQIFYDGSTTSKVFIAVTSSTNALTKAACTSIFTSGDSGSFVFKIPITQWASATTGFNAGQVANSWSGYHSGDCSYAVTAPGTTFTETSDDGSCTFATYSNSNFGTVVGYGSTKAGFTFTPSRIGKYFVCAQTWVAKSTSGEVGIQLTDGTTAFAQQIGYSTASGFYMPMTVCGQYNATSTTSKTIKLFVNGPGGGNIVVNGGTDNHAIDWNIFQIDQQFPAPLLVNSVITPYQGVTKISSVSFGGDATASVKCSSTPCTIASQSGTTSNNISSVSRTATGQYTVNFVAGVFSAIPTCNATSLSLGTTGLVTLKYDYTNSTSIAAKFTAFNAAGTGEDDGLSVVCTGPH